MCITHDALKRSSITCSYFISSSAWVFIKISGAAAKTHPHHVTPTRKPAYGGLCNRVHRAISCRPAIDNN